LKGRRYLQTQLGIGSTAAAAQPALQGTPGQVFTDEHSLDRDNGFLLSLGGIGTESYLAAERVDAAFVKFDLDFNDHWRIAGGARYEDFKQLSVPVNQHEYSVDVPKIPVPVDQLHTLITEEDGYYPSLSLTYK